MSFWYGKLVSCEALELGLLEEQVLDSAKDAKQV